MRSDTTPIASILSLLLGLFAAVALVLYNFSPFDVFLFDSFAELIGGPFASLGALIIAILARRRSKSQSRLQVIAVVVNGLIFVLWFAFSLLIYVAYSNCPDGVC